MEALRLEVSPQTRARMDYGKFSGPVPRILFLESRYWLDSACMNAAKRLGWETAQTPVVMEGRMPRAQVASFLRTLLEFRPDFVLSINLSGMDAGGLFAGLLEELQVPRVTWFVDEPRTILMGKTLYGGPFAVALTWEAAYAAYLTQCGFAEVHSLPLAVDDTVFNAVPLPSWDLPPAFVGNSMADFADREWQWFADRPVLAAAIQEAFADDRVTRETFAEGVEAFLPSAFAGTLDSEERRHTELYCFIEGTRRLRAELVRTLAPVGINVRGDDRWHEIAEECGPYVNYEEDLPAFYRRSVINVNSTSIQMKTAANQRVFDCPAAGGFLLTDAQPALWELFDAESEIACYHGMEECKDRYRYFLAHPSARQQIITRARSRIFAEHTYVHRMQSIAKLVRRRYT